jgi:hypothetical protein
MKFNLEEEILALDNKSLGVKYGKAISDILLSPAQDDNGFNKYRYYTIAMKLLDKEEIELDKEEVGFILQKIERVSPPLIYGRIRDFLETKDS